MTATGLMPLEPSLVPRPEMSRLALRVSPVAVDVAITSRVNDNPMLWRRLPVEPDATTGGIDMHAFEEAVYDNRLLLADFAGTDILIDTCRFMVVPAERADAEMCMEMFSALYPDEDIDVVITPVEPSVTSIAMAVAPALMSFVRRTFGEHARVSHRLAPLCRYFALKSREGNAGKLHVHLENGRVDVMAYCAEGLLMANSFRVQTTEDALFYVLAAARNLSFDNASDRVIVSGDIDMRDRLLPMLRKSISCVMPMIFPSDVFSSGKESLDAPFELVTIPLID